MQFYLNQGCKVGTDSQVLQFYLHIIHSSPLKWNINRCSFEFLPLHIEWLLVLNLFAIIATDFSGVLVRWVWLAILGTKVSCMVSAAPVSALLVCCFMFLDFIWKPQYWWPIATVAFSGRIGGVCFCYPWSVIFRIIWIAVCIVCGFRNRWSEVVCILMAF